ncbi:MAG TPA: phytoene/squalene synthase family protein [Solirubrobacteraceae bacterium]|nr:phytoene/squalene synthase family protein [Solirubrobacteraceae bacterium]
MLAPRRDDATLVRARDTTNRVARTFAIACRMLPREVRSDVYRLYLVFRGLDDLVDFGDPRAPARVGAVEAWCGGRASASACASASEETRILEALDRRYELPRDALLDFCRGMRDDLGGRPFATEEELETYCYRVAGTVGIVMSALLGVRPGADHRPAAAALGKAMQRTNILRDIDEDLASGRVYLARETVERYGAPAPGHRAELLRDQIARADALYDEGIAGIALLASGRRAIRAAAAMYREILRQIEREGYGARPGRVVVPRPRKLLVAARSAAA